MERAQRGHNGPPFDFVEFFDMIVNTSASIHEKMLSLVIARHAHRAGGTAAPKRADILRQASSSEATFKRSHDLLKSLFEITPKRGATTQYAPKPSLTVDQVEAAVAAFKTGTKVHSDTSFSESEGHKARVSVIPGSQSEGLSDTNRSQSEGLCEPQSEPSEKVPPYPHNINPSGINTPPTPQRPKSRRDPFGLNPTLQAEHQDVWFDENDRLQVANGFEVELLETVGSPEQLRVELDCATERIGPKTPGTVLKAKVRGQIQKQIAFRRDQDRRYQERIAKGKPDWRDDDAERSRKLQKALEKARGKYSGQPA